MVALAFYGLYLLIYLPFKILIVLIQAVSRCCGRRRRTYRRWS